LWRAGEDVNRVLLLEPSHFRQYPVSKNVIDFFMQLARNISGIQIFCGTIDMLSAIYGKSKLLKEEQFIAKEHPTTTHYPGKKDNRDWMFPQVRGYHPSFFSYWKKCERYL
jgi:deoxyribodipyrimidine photo-lyase